MPRGSGGLGRESCVLGADRVVRNGEPGAELWKVVRNWGFFKYGTHLLAQMGLELMTDFLVQPYEC